MKNRGRKLLGWVLCIAMLMAMVSAANGEGAGHTHEWGEWETTDGGTKHIRRCQVIDCVETETHTISWSPWEIDGDVETVHFHVCTGDNCSILEREPHQYEYSSLDENNHTGKCKDCGKTIQEEAHTWGSGSDETNHWEECIYCHVTKNKEAHSLVYKNYGVEGHMQRCSSENCDYCVTKEPVAHSMETKFDATGHWTECVCGEKTEKEEHSWGNWEEQADGVHQRECTKCGATETGKHEWGNWKEQDGKHQRECTKCGATETGDHVRGIRFLMGGDYHQHYCAICEEVFETGAHTYIDGVCSVCEWVCKHEDTEIRDAVEASCKGDGYSGDTYCLDCGLKIAEGEKIDQTPHPEDKIVTDAAVAPTCTEAGKTEGKHCSVCGGVLKAQTVIPAIGHIVTEVKAVPATCTKPGNSAYWHCMVCGKYFGDAACTEVIDKDSWIISPGHNPEKVEEVPATCEKTGMGAYWKCTREGCGKLFSDADGTNEITELEPVNALGHDLEEVKKVDPTCTEPGTEAYWKCKREGCGKLFSDAGGKNEIAAPVAIPAGHEWGDGKITTPATCTTKGVRTYTCKRNPEHTKTETIDIDPDAHPADKIVMDPARAATCTQDGVTDGVHCSACEAVIVKQLKTLTRLGHLMDWQPDEESDTHSAACERCKYTSFAPHAMYDFQINEDLSVSFCPVCGYVDGKYSMTPIDIETNNIRLVGVIIPGEILRMYQLEIANDRYLIVSIEKDGKPIELTKPYKVELNVSSLEDFSFEPAYAGPYTYDDTDRSITFSPPSNATIPKAAVAVLKMIPRELYISIKPEGNFAPVSIAEPETNSIAPVTENGVVTQFNAALGCYSLTLTARSNSITFLRQTLEKFQKVGDNFLIITPGGSCTVQLSEILNFHEKAVNFRFIYTGSGMEIFANGELCESISSDEMV